MLTTGSWEGSLRKVIKIIYKYRAGEHGELCVGDAARRDRILHMPIICNISKFDLLGGGFF